MDTNQLYRKQGTTNVVNSTGQTQNFTGDLGSLPIYNNTITTNDLKQTTPIQLPQTSAPTIPKPSQVDYDSFFGLTDFQKQAQGIQEQGLSEIIKSMGVLQNEATDLAQERKNRGLEELYKSGQATKNRILALDAEIQQDDIQLAQQLRAEERRDTLLPFAQMGQAKIAGDAAIMRALKTAEKNTLISQQLANQGEIELAEKFAKDAIDAKYAPYKQNIENMKSILELIKPTLTAAENKLLKVQELKANQAEREILKAEENEKAINKMIIDATPNAPASVIANAKAIAQKGGSSLEVAQALGQYGGDYLGDKLKRMQIAKAGEEINKLRAEIKATTTPISTTNIPNTSTGFVQKLLLTAKNDKNLDTSERQQLSKMGMVITQLGALQSNLSKNNKTGVIKGRVNKLLGDLNLDKDITTINAQIQALIPNVARGIYGEVGVLTDADITNYKKTVANLTNSKDQNDAVLALTLKNALKSYENTLNTASNSGINVSGWAEDYLKINNQVKTIEDRIGVSKEAVNNLIIQDKNLAPVVKELYQNGLTDGEILDALNAR